MGRWGWRWWAAALGTAAVLRAFVALVLLGGMPMLSDARDYFDAAVRFASGEFGGAFYWPPGESLVLACALGPLGKSVLVARFVTIATSIGSVALSALLARELAGAATGRIAAWIAALYVPSVVLCGQTYAQHLAALCLAAVAYFGLRALRDLRLGLFAWTGVALGLGCLTRPSMASVVPVLLAAWAHAAHHRRASLCALGLGAIVATCGALAFVIPAQAHNWRAGAGWTISTNNERNLWLGNNPYTPDYKTSHLGQRPLDELPPDARTYLESFYARPDARPAMKRAALAYMAHHPLRTAWRTLNRATSFWGFDYLGSREVQNWRGWGTRTALPLLALEVGSYVAVAVLALAGLLVHPGACAPQWRVWLIALTLAYQLPYAIAFSGGTYHFPVVPLVMPFAAVALANAVEAGKRARERKGAAIVAMGAFALIQAQYAYFALTMRPERLSQTRTDDSSPARSTRSELCRRPRHGPSHDEGDRGQDHDVDHV
jgi:4-amino-4-deoxy-L-arabinose transferase-like glycosyltransferase